MGRNERRLPPPLLRELREHSFDFLAAFCHCFPRNQEAIFDEFSTVLANMAGVRKATTCAQAMLLDNPTNCAAVTEEHLEQLISLMSGGEVAGRHHRVPPIRNQRSIALALRSYETFDSPGV